MYMESYLWRYIDTWIFTVSSLIYSYLYRPNIYIYMYINMYICTQTYQHIYYVHKNIYYQHCLCNYGGGWAIPCSSTNKLETQKSEW